MNEPLCHKCGASGVNNFYIGKWKNGSDRYRCKLCARISNKYEYANSDKNLRHNAVNIWRHNNSAQWACISKKARVKIRLEAILAYSANMSCAICNESNIEFLAIDHINGGGIQHRKIVGRGVTFYRWLKKNGYPSGYRVLCHNCNFKYGKRDQPKRNFRNLDTYSPRIRSHMCYLLRHPEKHEELNEKKRKNRAEIKNSIINHYGGMCICCGLKDIDILSIDHINNDGAKHRKITISSGTPFYEWIIDNNFPADLQILCLNCNKSKGSYGYCPHQHKTLEFT